MSITSLAKITVLGAGVIGLTTALELQKAGFIVDIITEKLPLGLNTTSNKAAAIWFPYNAEPRAKINKWSRESYDRFLSMCRVAESGVKIVEAIYLTSQLQQWWIPAFPAGTVKKATAVHLPEGHTRGLVVQVPFIDTPIYLRYLIHCFKENGGTFTLQRVDKEVLKALISPSTLLINCTGLDARVLFDDPYLYPVQGYITKVAAPQQQQYILHEEGELSYIIPRSDGVILGGTAVDYANSTDPEPGVIEAIISRCQALSPQLQTLEILEKYIGLRPARKGGIRLEPDPDRPIIHNYGHGGSGFTVSWGCAREVLQLVQGRLTQ